MSAGDRFDKHASDVLRRQGSDLVAAARSWCDEHAPTLPSMAIDWCRARRAPDIVKVIRIATMEEPLLGKMFEDLLMPARPGEHPSVDALFPLMVLWPIRGVPERYGDALAVWARERARVEHSCAGRPYLAAMSLRKWPELAYAMLEALEKEPGLPCPNCRADAQSRAHRRRVMVVLTRRRERLEHHVLDDEAVAAISVSDVLEDGVRALTCDVARLGGLPPRLLSGIREAAASGNPIERLQSLRVLLASPTDQEQAIRRLAGWVSERDVVVDFMLNGVLDGACMGVGWGRDNHNLARKVLPFTSSLWQRHSAFQRSPMYPLRCLFSSDDDEGAWNRVRDCVAEHLLETALRSTASRAIRMAALDAFEALEPGGDGSAITALARVRDDREIAARAKAVQRALRQKARKGRLADSELAVDDAWRVYWSSVDRTEP